MRRYDYAFLKNEIPGSIVGLTEVIADLKSKESFRKRELLSTYA